MITLENDGCHLALRVSGSGPPILFVQGVGVQGNGWGPQVAGLSDRYTCLTFDNRGLGGSQPLGTPRLTVDRMVADCVAIVDSMGWDRFHVVGHSMGGHIAAALAVSAPSRVHSLALLCTSARGGDMPPLTASFLWTSVRSRVGTRRQRRLAFLEMVLPASLRRTDDLDEWARRLADLFGHDLADTPPVVMKQIRAYRTHDATPGLRTLEGVRTLVVSADEDPLAPPTLGRALASTIQFARYAEVPDAAHGVTVTHAGEINRLLERHFEGTDQMA